MEDLDKLLQILGVVLGAGLLIKEILEEDDGKENQIPHFIQKDFDWKNPNLGDLG